MDFSRTHNIPVVQLHDTGGGRSELESREPLESNILHSTNLFLDLELHWQDLLGVLEPQVRYKQHYYHVAIVWIH